MVWSIPVQRFAALAATIVFSACLLSGCVADTPNTQLSWFPKSDRVNAPRPTPRPRLADLPRPVKPKPVRVASLDCPVPTAKPSTPRWYTDASTPQPATYTPVAGAGFAWPLAGQVISDFGADQNGGRNAGIDIAAPFGTPIRASASGEISYAGNELRGYGNLVLIKHDDGYVTAYAHAERIVVNRGDYVQKGQIIGYAGQTGDVSGPELHFEIRKGVTPLNPRSMLAPLRAS